MGEGNQPLEESTITDDKLQTGGIFWSLSTIPIYSGLFDSLSRSEAGQRDSGLLVGICVQGFHSTLYFIFFIPLTCPEASRELQALSPRTS